MPLDLDLTQGQPGGDLNIGPAQPVPPPTTPAVEDETKSQYTARQRAAAPEPRTPKEQKGLDALGRLETRYRTREAGSPITPEELVAAQERAKALPPPDEAVRLRKLSEARGEPFGLTLLGPPEKQPFPRTWSDYGERTGLPAVLLDPTKSVFASQEDLDKLVLAAGVQDNPFPSTRLGLGIESGVNEMRRGRLYFDKMVNGGVLPPGDAIELRTLDARRALLPTPEGLKGQVLEGALQQFPRFGRMALVGGAGALTGLAFGPAAPGAAPALAGAAVFADNAVEYMGHAYDEYTNEWGLEHQIAMPLAVLEGLGEAGLDTLSFGILTKFPALNALKNVPVLKKLAFRQALKSAVKDARFTTLLKEVAKDGFTEGSTEMLQEAWDILLGHAGTKIGSGEYRTPSAQEAGERLLVSGITGAAVGAGFGGVGTLAREIVTNVHVAEGTKTAIDRLYDVTDGLKLNDRAPAVTKEVIDKQAAQGPVKTVSVPLQEVEGLISLNQESPAVKEFLARPDIARALALARETGGRVKMSLGDFVAYIRPLDASGKLKTEIGLNDGMSIAEAKDLKPRIEQAKKEMQDIAKRREMLDNLPESAIIADLEAKLRKVGATAEAARIQAELVASGIATLSRRVGKDAWATYKSAPITIGSVTHETFDTTTLEQADPKGVARTDGGAFGDSMLVYQHPESPMSFVVHPEKNNPEFSEPTRVAGLLDLGVPETKENLKKYGGQGYSTALYVKALTETKDAKAGWASDTSRTPATERMYPRLQRLGVPFKLVESLPGNKYTADRYMISAADLQKVDLEQVWRNLENEVRSRKDETTGQFAKVSDAEIDAILAGLVELKQNQKGIVRGRITFNPKTRDFFHITLTGKANLSTFLHESSHYLLELMRKLAIENPGTDLDADLKVLEEWAGVKPGGEWTTEALEKFARGMETYLGEGKAPSKKLEGAFATVKAWILRVYKMLVNLNAPLTDEVRSVMDRMLATQEEIEARKLELGYFPKELGSDMAPEAQLAYREMYERGVEQAQARLDREAIAGLKKEQTAEYQKIKAQVEQEVSTHPAVALREWFGTGERVDGGLAIPEFAGKKLDREAVAAMNLGPGILPKIRQYLTDGKLEKGIDPEELAPYFRFKNGAEMVQSLAATPSRETLAKQMVKERMTALYPEYGQPGWVEKTALEKLHGEDSIANAIELEIAAAHKKLSEVPPKNLAAVAKLAASEAVQEMTREEQDPAHWRDAERRAQQEQMQAWAAKDFKLAAEAGRKRLYARAMWDATSRAAERMDRAKRYVTRFGNPDVLGRIGRASPIEVEGTTVGGLLRDAASAIAEATGLVGRTNASDLAIDARVSRIEALGLPVDVDASLREGQLPKWDEMSYEQAMAVQDALKSISHVASEANEIRIGEEKASLDAIGEGIEKDLAERNVLNRLGAEGEKRDWLREHRVQIAKPETLAEDIGPTFHKVWFGTAEKGQFEEERRFREHRRGLRALAKEFQPKGWAKTMKQKFVFDADGRTYTGANVFAMLENLGTESNVRKMILGAQRAGLNWTYENVVAFIHKVFPDLAPYRYAQEILNFISKEDLFEDSAKVHEILSGTRPEKVEARSIPTPDGGSIPGGYYPEIYDRRVPTKDVDTAPGGLEELENRVLSKYFAAHSFTHTRTGYVAPILLDPRALAGHIYEVDHYISNAQGILARHKLLSNPRVKNAIVHSLGFDYWDQMRLSNNYIARDGEMLSAEVLQASKIANSLIYHNALLVMGGNVLSGVNQIVSGVPATLARLGPRGFPAFAKALVEFVRSPLKTWEEVGELSGEIKNMQFHYDRDLRMIVARELAGETWPSIQSSIANTTMAPVVFGQKIVNVLTWKAAYDIALRDGKVGEDAILFANSAVRQSQSTAGPKDMAAVQRSKDGLMRVLTSLASYTFTLNDLVMPRRLTKDQLLGHTGRLLVLMMTSMVAKALMDQMFPKLAEKDDERRKGLEKMAADSDYPALVYAVEALDDVFYNVPVVGRVGQSVVSGREPRFASWVDDGIKALQAAPDAFSEKGLTKRELKAIVDTLGLVTGMPTRHLLFGPGEFVNEYLDGNVDDAPWAFFQELALARPGQKGDR